METVLDFAKSLNLVDRINRAISFNPNAFNSRLWQIPCYYNHRLRNSAGNANRFRICLHPGLQQATELELTTTFLHELAHVMDYLENGQSSHGYGWWQAMIRLGENPQKSRYHNIFSCKKAISRPKLEDIILDDSLG